MKSFSSSIRRSHRVLLAILASSAVFTAGCANMATTAGESNSMGNEATIGGRIHGGANPVAFATVNLWFAGQGPSSPPSIGATTKSANDGAGSFSFIKSATNGQAGSGNTFSCPNNSTLVYVVATGGNTQNTGDPLINNAAAVFVAPFGPCGNTGGLFVDMNEVTTVATMAALQQYFNPNVPAATATSAAGSFSTGGSGLALTAMTNAFSLIQNMVNLPNGTAVQSKSIPAGSLTAGVGYAGTSTVATPEYMKVNTIANILAACINAAASNKPACLSLLSNAVPPDPTTTALPAGTLLGAPQDTLGAVYYMLTNPTSSPVNPSGPSNIQALFNLGVAAGSPFSPSLPGPTGPSDWTIAISYDGGNLPANACGANSGHLIKSVQDIAVDIFGAVWLANNEPTKGNLSQISTNGVPATCIQMGTGANTGVTIDSTPALGNVWVADSGASNVYRYAPTTTNPLAFPTAAAPRAISADGTGNVFFTSTTSATLYEVPGGAAAPAAVTPLSIATAIGGVHVFVDSAPSVWTTSGSTSMSRSASATPNTGLGYTSTPFTTLANSYAIAVTGFTGTKNNVYVDAASVSNNSVSQFQGSGTSYTSSTGWSTTGLTAPTAVASDGAQNIWVLSNTGNSVVEIGAAQQQLSPATGFQKSATYLGGGRSMAIDSSGNVWIGLDGTTTITQIVGAAVPVYQPFAAALKNGSFQVAP